MNTEPLTDYQREHLAEMEKARVKAIKIFGLGPFKVLPDGLPNPEGAVSFRVERAGDSDADPLTAKARYVPGYTYEDRQAGTSTSYAPTINVSVRFEPIEVNRQTVEGWIELQKDRAPGEGWKRESSYLRRTDGDRVIAEPTDAARQIMFAAAEIVAEAVARRRLVLTEAAAAASRRQARLLREMIEEKREEIRAMVNAVAHLERGDTYPLTVSTGVAGYLSQQVATSATDLLGAAERLA